MNESQEYAGQQVGVQTSALAKFLANVYGWMFGGLLLTAGAAGFVAGQGWADDVAGSGLFWGLIIIELALVLVISFAINRIPATVAALLFILYAALNGITLSFIFLAYTSASIAGVFMTTAGMFGAMSLYGYVTKRDLTTMGNILLMLLIGMIIAWVVNIFLKSGTLSLVLSWIGVFVFTGLTAYDTQRIKEIGMMNLDEESANRAAVVGALALYLDFINLFLSLLRIFGSSRE